MTTRKTTPTTAKAPRKTTAPARTTPAPKTTTAKPKTAAAGAKAAPAPKVVSETAPVVSAPDLKKKELLDRVVERSGVKKKFAKPVVEAMMDVLGEAIAEGREMNLQPLGKVKHQRTKDMAKARVTVAKIRQNKSAAPALDKAKDKVADGAE